MLKIVAIAYKCKAADWLKTGVEPHHKIHIQTHKLLFLPKVPFCVKLKNQILCKPLKYKKVSVLNHGS